VSVLVARNASEQHAAVVDRDTAMHAGVGVAAGALGISVTAAVLASLGVEFAYLATKRGARRAAFDKVEPASSIANHAADVVATVGGVYVGRWIVRRYGAGSGSGSL
jgi:hypothetical protein